MQQPFQIAQNARSLSFAPAETFSRVSNAALMNGEAIFYTHFCAVAADLFPTARIRFAAQFGLARAAQSFFDGEYTCLIFLSSVRVRIRHGRRLATRDACRFDPCESPFAPVSCRSRCLKFSIAIFYFLCGYQMSESLVKVKSKRAFNWVHIERT